jgi:hypothetical protein
MIPIPAWAIKIGTLALAAVAALWWAYDAGQDSKKGELNAVIESHRIAAAQAAGREAERLRMWTNAVKVSGEKYAERAKIADSSFDASLDRLRNAFNSVKGVRFTAAVAGECPAASGPAAGDLLRHGEAIAELARRADKDRAALASCVAAWPK